MAIKIWSSSAKWAGEYYRVLSVDLANLECEWQNVNVRPHFLKEFKKEELMILRDIPGVMNRVDLYTKTFNGSKFDKDVQTIYGKDKYGYEAE